MVLNVIFGFLLAYNPVISVTLFSIIILIFINMFYKILINQNDAKQIKEKTKELNKQMKEAQKAGNKDESSRLLSEAMKENSRLMRMTMKPMIVSFIIIIVMLPWLSGNYETFGAITNNSGNISVKGVNYTFSINDSKIAINGAQEYDDICDGKCFIIGGTKYEASRDSGNLFSSHDAAKLSVVVATLPIYMPVVGYDLGWLGWYILVSFPFVILIRKFMKIYA